MTSNGQVGRCAVILVGDGDDPNLQGIAHIMKRREVPFLNAVGIVEAVDRVADWIAYANQCEPSTASIPVTTVDFVGHAAQGRFFFGKDPKHVLSSCPDSYCRLEKLRKLVHAPSDTGIGSRWGLRLIGCDVANDEFV